MKAFVVIATKGRPKETYTLLDSLSNQSFDIENIIVVGSEDADVLGLASHPLSLSNKVSIKTTDAGLTIQRNAGLDFILHRYQHSLNPHDWFVVFFDDDFRPATNWVYACAEAFKANNRLLGLGGQVLADGISGVGLTETQAQAYISKELLPEPHEWSGNIGHSVPDLYGCNMAYRGSIANKARFDENLPFYGWLEDVDYSVNASKSGELTYLPAAKGVHLGVSGGRTSGIRFGYSQIANPLYLIRKQTMPKKKALLLMMRNIASNIFHTVTFKHSKDYPGRLYGNCLAFLDAVRRKCHPAKIKKL